MGRRSKASDARIETVLIALRAGNTREAAATHAEIDRTTLHRWIRNDPALRARIEKAEADAEVRYVALISQAAAGEHGWRAATWWLERRRRAAYGNAPITVVVEPTDDQQPLDELSPADQARQLRLLADEYDAPT
jgi:hypothetical protein